MSNTNATANSRQGEANGAPKKKATKKKNAARAPRAVPAATKQELVLSLLRQGTTIAAIMQAAGWQQHSVRGFFAGMVRKKLGLNLTSKKTESGRVYRIGAGKPAKAPKAAARKAG